MIFGFYCILIGTESLGTKVTTTGGFSVDSSVSDAKEDSASVSATYTKLDRNKHEVPFVEDEYSDSEWVHVTDAD
jgi:hypothetical protein